MHRFFSLVLFAVALTPGITRAELESVSLQGPLDNGKAFSLSFQVPTFSIDPGAASQVIAVQNLTLSINAQVVQQPVSLDARFGTNVFLANTGWSTAIAAFDKPFIGETASGTQGQFLPGTYDIYGFFQQSGVYSSFHHENARLTVAAVPEPSVLALVLVGGLSLFGFHLRRRGHRTDR
ncbi:MAG TPA: PEP-CTERM sorting domain-containing protein [Chthoniobacterales bacterium]